jgi:hypothetical protein
MLSAVPPSTSMAANSSVNFDGFVSARGDPATQSTLAYVENEHCIRFADRSSSWACAAAGIGMMARRTAIGPAKRVQDIASPY